MRVTNRHGQGIGGVVRRGSLAQAKQQLHHLLHLTLVRSTVADHCQLDLGRRVFRHLTPGVNGRKHRYAPGVTEFECTTDIGRVKQVLDGDALGRVLGQQRGKFPVNSSEALRK